MRSEQSVRQPVQAILDHLAIAVVAKSKNRSTALVKMFVRPVELAELAVTLAEIEVQGGIEASHRISYAAASRAFVRE